MKHPEDLRAELTAAGILGSPLTRDTSQTVRETLQLIAEAHGTSVKVLTDQNRSKRASRARRDAYAALRHLGLSLPEIGKAIGGRNHSTVQTGLAKREKELKELAAAQAAMGLR